MTSHANQWEIGYWATDGTESERFQKFFLTLGLDMALFAKKPHKNATRGVVSLTDKTDGQKKCGQYRPKVPNFSSVRPREVVEFCVARFVPRATFLFKGRLR